MGWSPLACKTHGRKSVGGEGNTEITKMTAASILDRVAGGRSCNTQCPDGVGVPSGHQQALLSIYPHLHIRRRTSADTPSFPPSSPPTLLQQRRRSPLGLKSTYPCVRHGLRFPVSPQKAWYIASALRRLFGATREIATIKRNARCPGALARPGRTRCCV